MLSGFAFPVLLSFVLMLLFVNVDKVDKVEAAAPVNAVMGFRLDDNLFSIFECDIKNGPFFVAAKSLVSSIIDS